jgi:hypothetical protein
VLGRAGNGAGLRQRQEILKVITQHGIPRSYGFKRGGYFTLWVRGLIVGSCK